MIHHTSQIHCCQSSHTITYETHVKVHSSTLPPDHDLRSLGAREATAFCGCSHACDACDDAVESLSYPREVGNDRVPDAATRAKSFIAASPCVKVLFQSARTASSLESVVYKAALSASNRSVEAPLCAG